MSEKMVRCDVNNETGNSHMVTVVTEDMYHLINLMNDYNLNWLGVYNIVKDSIETSDCLKCKHLQKIPKSNCKVGFPVLTTYVCLKNKHEDKMSHPKYYCNAYEEKKEVVTDD